MAQAVLIRCVRVSVVGSSSLSGAKCRIRGSRALHGATRSSATMLSRTDDPAAEAQGYIPCDGGATEGGLAWKA